jgi:hypothetical protein
MSKIIRIFLVNFFIEKYQFRSTFFVIFEALYFLKWCPIFDVSGAMPIGKTQSLTLALIIISFKITRFLAKIQAIF